MKFGTFTLGNVNSGVSVILARFDISLDQVLRWNTKKFCLGRDHLVRIRHLDCSCRVINLHDHPDCTLQELRLRLRAAAALWPTFLDGIGFLVGVQYLRPSRF